MTKRAPGAIRDEILNALRERPTGASIAEILETVKRKLGGEVAASSVRSYLRLNTPAVFERIGRGKYRLRIKK